MPKAPPAGDLISDRQLNRTLLQRQMLLERTSMPALDAVEHLVGLQAQEQLPPYISMWSRLKDFDPMELSGHIADRSAVRLTVMRGTVHLHSARDALMVRPIIQPVLDRMFKGGVWIKGTAGADLDEVIAVARQLLEEKPRPNKDLSTELQKRWPEQDGKSLAYAVTSLTPLVHIPPRGLWQGVGQTTLTTFEKWLGVSPDMGITEPDEMIRRYLAAFGPASVMDAQAWCGLTKFKEAFERLRPELRSYCDEKGKELFDLVDGSLADPDLPAPPRFFGTYDNLFLGHADRSRVGNEAFRKMMMAVNGYFATFTVDGFLRGRWAVERDKKASAATLKVLPWQTPLTKAEAIVVEEEARRLVDFLHPEAASRDVAFLPAQEA